LESVVSGSPRGTTEEVVRVELGARSYPIYIGAGIIETIGPRLRERGAASRLAVVTNPTVAQLYADRVCRSLEETGFTPVLIEIPDGEEHKNLASLASIYDRLIAAQLDRGATLVALGGGVVGDIGGLAAATFLRGVSLVQVPTTLVAQVDASVGGKTAINHQAGKNLIGAFYQPRMVLADVEVLGSLPHRELVSGLAEVIKYAIILDADFFDFLESALPQALDADPEVLRRIVSVCCRLKAAVVGEDETESGYRAVLNFGHTVGHAIEVLTDYNRYLHGEAVAVGMVFATLLSEARGYCDPATGDRIRRLVERARLPVEVPRDIDAGALASAIGVDKKTRDGAVKFVCVEAIGRSRFERIEGRALAAYLTMWRAQETESAEPRGTE
jgi:3-dehydroquinate synthase